MQAIFNVDMNTPFKLFSIWIAIQYSCFFQSGYQCIINSKASFNLDINTNSSYFQCGNQSNIHANFNMDINRIYKLFSMWISKQHSS